MLRHRLYWTGLFVAVVSLVVDGGGAEARCGCRYRQGWRSNGGYAVGWNQYNGYSSNVAQGTYVNGNPTVNGNTATMQNPAGSTIQTNNNYSAARPTYANQPAPATQVVVPNQYNTVPRNYPEGNPSPDVDNSAKGLTTSAIPGTSPSKAPEPPAAAAAPR